MSDLQADIKTPSFTWQDIEHKGEGGRAGLLPLMGFLKNAITHLFKVDCEIVCIHNYTCELPYSVAMWLAH